jgi:hypothetical protein
MSKPTTWGGRWNRKGIQMRKISLIALVAASILVGVGIEAGAWTAATSSALTANPVMDPPVPANAKDLATSHYDDFSLVFPAVIGQ